MGHRQLFGTGFERAVNTCLFDLPREQMADAADTKNPEFFRVFTHGRNTDGFGLDKTIGGYAV